MEAFYSKVSPCPLTGCHWWTGATQRTGYGNFGVAGRTVRASRFAWELAHGPIPAAGMLVCHHCDQPGCVNEAHLFLGTPLANMQDMRAKGRQRYGLNPATGERHGRAKLTAAVVVAARQAHSAGVSIHALARKYNVARSTMQAALRGQHWGSV